MTQRKSIVAQNDPRDSFNLFGDELVPEIIDVRGEKVRVDFGDYLHGVLDHPHMLRRIRWIAETLKNPEEIRRHWDKRLRHREIYVNTIYESEDDLEGELHLVIVDRRRRPAKLWTTFVPKDREKYLSLIRKGELLWRPKS